MEGPLYPFLRFGLYAELLLLAGLATWLAFGPATTREIFRRVLPTNVIAWLAGTAILIAAAAMLVSIGTMMGQPVFDLEGSSIKAIVLGTGMGWAFVARMIALAGAFVICLLPISKLARLRLVTLLATVALGSLAWSGHAAVTEAIPGTLHRLNDATHLLAAAVWIGAIIAFARAAWSPGRSNQGVDLKPLATSLRDFAPVGTVLVLVIAVTGIANLVFIVGLEALPNLWWSQYGILLLIKLALFAAMLAAAGLHRWILAPALHSAIEYQTEPARALRALRTSLAIEFSLSVAILAIVAWLGMLAPLAV